MEEEEETVELPDVHCSSLPATRLEQSPPASSRKTDSQLTANARRRSLRRRPSIRPCKATSKQSNVTLPVDVSISSDKHPSTETQAAENTKKRRVRSKAAADMSKAPFALPNTSNRKYFVSTCRYSGKVTKSADMLRCGMYMLWLHPPCVGDSDNDTVHQGAWLCSQCRKLPNQVSTLVSELKKLREDISGAKCLRSAFADMQSNNMDLVTLLVAKTAQCYDLRNENTGLRECLAKSEARQTVKQLKLTKPNAPALVKKTKQNIIIGDSLLRDVKSCGIRNTRVYSRSNHPTCRGFLGEGKDQR